MCRRLIHFEMTTLRYEEVKEEPEVSPEEKHSSRSCRTQSTTEEGRRTSSVSPPASAAPRGEERRHDSPGRFLSFPQALLPQDARQSAATEATHAAGQRVQEPDAAGRHQRVGDREGR